PTADGRAAEAPTAVGPLARALEDGTAAGAATGPVRVGVTFKNQAGRYCRTFQGQAQAGVACRADDVWRVLAVSPAAAPASGQYRQAGSETPAAVMAVVDNMIAGAPLDAAGEAKAVKDGWR
ncbi:MAG: anti-sigma factor, partial [Caulobacter sp.]